MHTTNPELVAIKAAARQLSVRLDAEARATSQWASLSRNRGFEDVARELEKVVAGLEECEKQASGAAQACFDSQEEHGSGT